MSKDKELKLTNWQVPRNPANIKYDILKRSKPINMKNYENIVKEITREDSIKKAEAVVPAIHIHTEKNLKGVNDDRKKQFWTPPAYKKKK